MWTFAVTVLDTAILSNTGVNDSLNRNPEKETEKKSVGIE